MPGVKLVRLGVVGMALVAMFVAGWASAIYWTTIPQRNLTNGASTTVAPVALAPTTTVAPVALAPTTTVAPVALAPTTTVAPVVIAAEPPAPAPPPSLDPVESPQLSGPTAFDDRFARGNNPVGNGWVDVNSKWSIVSNSLQTTSRAFDADWLLRPASESLTDQQVSITFPLAPATDGSGLHSPMLLARVTPDRGGYAAWVSGRGTSLSLNLVSITAGVFALDQIRSTLFANLTEGQNVVATLYAIGIDRIATVALASNPSALLATTVQRDFSQLSGVGGVSPNGLQTNIIRRFTTVSKGFNPPAIPPFVLQMGLNVSYVNDYQPEFTFADALKHARGFAQIKNGYGGTEVPVDAHGFPKADFSVLIGAAPAIYYMAGRYTVLFPGQAIISMPDTVGATVVSNKYDAPSNTSIVLCDVAPSANPNLIRIAFTQTRRRPADTKATGLANLKIMRPIAPGSKTSHDPTEIFSRAWLAMNAPFHHLRFLDQSNAVNGYPGSSTSTLIPWSFRTLPSTPIQAQVNPDGTAYEYMIAACNANNQNMWLTIPDMASDDYFTQLCNLVAYGSDGTLAPYTGLHGSTGAKPYPKPNFSPLHAPLRGKFYFQFGNENWNGQFLQNRRCIERAKASVAALAAQNPPGKPDINWDGEVNTYYWGFRFEGRQIVRLSNLAKSVFGPNQLGVKFFPLLMGQDGNPPTLDQPLKYIAHVTDGAPETAICAAGCAWYRSAVLTAPDRSSPWYNPKDGTQGRSVDQIIAAGTDKSSPSIALTSRIILQYAPKIEQWCYEGGTGESVGKPSNLGGNGGEKSVLSQQVEADPRFQSIEAETIRDSYAGGARVLTYYNSTNGAFGLYPSPFNLSTPKGLAVQAAITAINAGNPPPSPAPIGASTPALPQRQVR